MRIEKRGPSGYEYSSPRGTELGAARRAIEGQRRRRRILKLVIALAVIAVIVVICAIAAVKLFSYSKERMDLTEYFGTEDGSVAVFVDYEQITNWEPEPAVRKGENIYFLLEFADTYLSNRFYYNADGTLRYMNPEEIITIEEGDTGWSADGEDTELGIACFYTKDDGSVYISADMLQMFTDISVTDYTDPDRVFIELLGGDYQEATVKKNTQIRYRGGPKSDILIDVESGENVRVLSELDNWVEVSYGGVIGYIPEKSLGEIEEIILLYESRVPEFSTVRLGTDVLLMWHQVYSYDSNSNLEAIVESAPGLNVVCPTWYSLTDSSGSFSSFSDADYVARAHALGVKVWAVVDDINGGISTDDLAAALTNTQVRENIIQALMTEASNVGLDGFNLDFENVDLAGCESEFTAFMREFSVECRKNGLILSVDNYVVSGGRTHDLIEENLICDYVVMMSYDEYWGELSGAGPTASLNWFRSGVTDTVAAGVSSEKIVNGIAAYTKIWSTFISGEIGYSSVSMGEAISTLTAQGVIVSLDETNGVMYGTYESNGSTYQVWYDNAETIASKLDSVSSYDIAGYAIWSFRWWSDWADEEVWSVITGAVDLR